MSDTAPTPYTLVARAGDTFTRVLTWTESDGTTAIDLTGASVEWSLTDGTTVITYEDETEASITTPASGEVTLALTPTQTRALFGSAWRYEVTITDAGGLRTTLIEGLLTVGREVAE